MNLDKIIEYNFNFDKREFILKEVSLDIKVKFALFCASLNLHKIQANEKDLKTIKDNLVFFENIGDYSNLNKQQIKDIQAAAYTAANTAYAANTADAAAYTANAAANAAAYAANTADAAAYTANAAANAAYTAANAADNPEEQKLIMMAYLRKLIITSLSEEDKSNELLMMSI